MAYPQMYSPFVLGRCTKDVDWDGIYKNLKQNGSNFFKVDTLIQMGIIQAKVGSVLGRSPFVQGRKEDRSFVMTIGVADNESREVFTEFTLHLNPNGRKACECFNLTLELLQAGTQEQRRQHIRTRNGLQFRAPCHSKRLAPILRLKLLSELSKGRTASRAAALKGLGSTPLRTRHQPRHHTDSPDRDSGRHGVPNRT